MNESCMHCGLQVPPGDRTSGDEPAFCCAGCRAVHAAIMGSGLGDYYRRRGETRAPAASEGRGGGHAILDSDAFQQSACREVGSDLREVELGIDGLHCGACIWLIERLPRVIPGLRSARVNLARRTVEIRWSPSVVDLSAVADGIGRLGYEVRTSRSAGDREMRDRVDRAWLVRIAVAAAIAGNVMGISFALYGGVFTGMSEEHRFLFRSISFGLIVLDLAWPGRVFLTGAITALRARTTHMDQPVSLGIVLATAAGLYSTIFDGAETWFEAVAMLVFLLLVGRWLQHRSQRSSQDAVERLFCLAPSTALRIGSGGEPEEVPSGSLQAGDRVRVRSGDLVPADGRCESGGAGLDRSLLTGESRLVRIGPGSPVHAGEACRSGTILMLVEEAGDRTRIASIMKSIVDHAHKRPRVVLLADRIAGWFVLGVVFLATITFLVGIRESWAVGVDRTVALLVVTCPCALGLATPLAMVAAIGRAASDGVLVKGGDVLEKLAKPGTILLDKTGTLTRGAMTVDRIEGEESTLAMAAAVEESSRHPIAAALAPFGDGRQASDVREHPGLGMEGIVDGRRVLVGSRRFMATRGIERGFASRSTRRSEVDGTATKVLVAVGGVVRAVLAVGDPIRPEAVGVIDRMRRRGWRVGLLSGDTEEIVRETARSVGIEEIDVHGEADPEQKVAVVASCRSRPIVMVGDGVNDAAAMAAADVGIAVHGGAEASLSTADVCLSSEGLDGVANLLGLARLTMNRIRINIAISIAWNLLFAVMAIVGVIGPVLAAVLMPVSSLSVVLLSMAAVRSSSTAGRPEARADQGRGPVMLARKDLRRPRSTESAVFP
ncbi:MAG: heavy metal translocating P-type ATPase [Phycisphaera sp.]|nr:heavy metal translocating P-type ATPase [Phycisphaera sp.]